jgi:hypothetical protein
MATYKSIGLRETQYQWSFVKCTEYPGKPGLMLFESTYDFIVLDTVISSLVNQEDYLNLSGFTNGMTFLSMVPLFINRGLEGMHSLIVPGGQYPCPDYREYLLKDNQEQHVVLLQITGGY